VVYVHFGALDELIVPLHFVFVLGVGRLLRQQVSLGRNSND
jgi:hypothetical protein